MIFDETAYWLQNAHIPNCLMNLTDLGTTREGLSLVDLKVSQGKIEQVIPADSQEKDLPSQDLQRQIVLPCLIDAHTHLDKGHIWERSPNLAGTFDLALEMAIADSRQYWQPEDVYRAHGVWA